MKRREGIVMSFCPICHCERYERLGPNPDFPYSNVLYCKGCGFMWTYPAPSQEILDKLYTSTYREARNEKATEEYLRNMDQRAASQKLFITKNALVKLNRDSRVLDIGCGAGLLLKAFAELSNDLTGFEPDIKMIEEARLHLPSNARLHAEAFYPGKSKRSGYHLSAASHVLEHIPDPIPFLTELLQIIDKDGIIFLEVPQETRWAVKEIVNSRYKGLMHLLFFNPNTLQEAIKRAGGDVVYLSTFGPDRNKFSLVHPTHSTWRRRLHWSCYSFLQRVEKRLGFHLIHPSPLPWSDIDWDQALFRETPQQGIWIRVIARKIVN